jgi:ABC-type Fe3+/spermidine/putrescine transport system ATPase subunit
VAREQVSPKGGEEVHAAVRPEKVRFGGSGDNVSAAEVKQVVYLGASTQYIVELEGGGRLVLYQQNAFDAAGPSEGDGVSVSWDAQNCLVLGG